MTAGLPQPDQAPRKGFEVHLDNFEGPFDLLLSLISKHQMEITEVALARVTDEFLSVVRAREVEWDLSQASEFLVVAATLLDLKAARLLPQGEVDDMEDLELLEARDLLFARLLQYRAFKDVAARFESMMEAPRRVPRDVPLESHFAMLLPELVWNVTPDMLAMLAARAMEPKATPAVSLTHLHNPAVSVRDQAHVVAVRLQHSGAVTFRALVADAESIHVVVARFLALLELFREAAVSFEQARSLGELTVRWTGGAEEVDVSAEFDEDDAMGVGLEAARESERSIEGGTR
ncbi:segregation and condensation protein A [Demequina capsici]|uniref:Segregation and condensation protein A n=1 Tax=Demequina capsici TaxID=3075620 RepID=A0AA96F9C3_9MICO|nr:ScpA family protein [Demequina sp. OYTSA14]WNM25914.1 ScpA family protein [Demequina sp. OYTSA14]